MVNVELYGGLPKVSEKVSVRRMGLVRAARRASCLPSHLVGSKQRCRFLTNLYYNQIGKKFLNLLREEILKR